MMNTPLASLKPPITENAMISLKLGLADACLTTVGDVAKYAKRYGGNWMNRFPHLTPRDKDSIVAALEAFYVERGAV